jgi:hypothetical protein
LTPTSHRKDLFITLLCLSLYLSFALAKLTLTSADPDLWGYLAFGRLFWETGRFPYEDVFAYVPTLKPWVYHEWLTGVLFYPVYQALGAPGLQILKYILGLMAVGFTYLTALKRGADVWGTVLVLLIVQGFLSTGYSPVRAQAFTYAFYAASLYLLERSRLSGRGRGLLWLVPLQIFWCNVHGGFLAGLGLIFLYAAGEALSRRPFLPYLGILGLAGLATLINPYGVQYWSYLFMAISLPRPEITEWTSAYQAFKSGQFLGEFSYFFIVLAVSLFFALRRRWRELTPILTLCLTIYLGLKHLRHQVFVYLLVGAYIPVLVTEYLKDMKADPKISALGRRLGWQAPLLAALLLILVNGYRIASKDPFSLRVIPRPELKEQHMTYYPVGALEFINQHRLAGSLLTDFNWGEYLIWNLYPRCRVSLDGRFETVYPLPVCREYFDFIYGHKNWRRFLEKYPPDMILVDSRLEISRLLRQEKSWREVYRDSGCVLFVKPNGQASDAILLNQGGDKGQK